MLFSQLPPTSFQPAFSGHETFALRGAWLKKAYDLLQRTPDLFAREDAFVLLGVGKNMAQSIRYWGRVCGLFERAGNTLVPTTLGHALLDDDGFDPFLVTPAACWLLHWQVTSRPAAMFTAFFAFNMLRQGEFTPTLLAEAIQEYVREKSLTSPSPNTLLRDIDCFVRCYLRPAGRALASAGEDALGCPLADLQLVQRQDADRYRLTIGPQANLPDALFVFALRQFLRRDGRVTAAFSELLFNPGAPGRVFRLDEDALLARLELLEEITSGDASFSDTAGVRQVRWASLAMPVSDADNQAADMQLLAAAFA